MNRQLHEKFHLEKNLSVVFIDSFAKQPYNLNDPVQQEAFNRETLKLWNIFSNNPTFEFKTIEDILEENQKLKEEVQWLNDVITNNISDLAEQISSVRTELAEHDEDISNIRTVHAGDIFTVSTEHAEDITSIRTDMDNIKNDLVINPVGNRHFNSKMFFYI